MAAMSDRPAKASIVSGYFGPLHHGHLDLIEAARARTGYLVVIVNNDAQQARKKGKVIQPDVHRLRIVKALRPVDDAYVAVDDGPGIGETLDVIRRDYPDTEFEFCNGGDRSPTGDPAPEAVLEDEIGLQMLYGVGGEDKADSSTRINEELSRADTPAAP